MNRRVWILVFLVAGTVMDRGFGIYQFFFASAPSQVLDTVTTMETPGTFLLIWISLVLPVILVVARFFIGFSQPENDTAFLSCLLFLSLSTVVSLTNTIHSYPPGIREFCLFFQVAQRSFASYLFLRFLLLFPSPSLIERKVPWLKSVLLITSIAGFVYALSLRFTEINSLSILKGVFQGFDMMMALTGLASLVMNMVEATVRNEKRRMTILLAGIMCGFLVLAVVAGYALGGFRGFELSWSLMVVVIALGVFFPLSFVYVTLRHRVIGIRMIFRRGLRYLLASRASYIMAAAFIFTTLYLTIGAATFHLQVSATPGFGWRLAAIAALAFALAMALPKMNRRLMPYMDRKFFHEAYNSQKILGDLSRAIQRQPTEPEHLTDLAITQISQAFFVDRVAVFLRGAKVVHENDDPEQTRGPSILWIHRRAGDFQCCRIHVRSGSQTHRIVSPEALQDLLLPANGFVVNELQRAVDNPQAFEIDWEDPDSWIQELTFADSPSDPEYSEKNILQQLNTRLLVPMVTNERLLGFLSLGERRSEEPYSSEEKELLMAVAHQMAVGIDYSLLSSRVAEQEKLRREIEIAKQVQGQLFPQRIPKMKTLDYVGICKAAREVGGDYYDFLEIGPGRLGFVVADISGKGISATLLMASLQALLRSHAHLHGDRAELLVWDINRLMYSSTMDGKYASLFYGFYDDSSRLLVYVNAGHLPPILYRKDSSILRLKTGGMVVGMMPDTTYRQEIVQLQPGDILLIFSDGITEAMNVKEQEFGEERLITLISSLADLPAASFSEALLNQIADYVGTAPQHDDSTLVVIKVL